MNLAYPFLRFDIMGMWGQGLGAVEHIMAWLDMDMSHLPIQEDYASVQLEPEDYKSHTGPDQAARLRQRWGHFRVAGSYAHEHTLLRGSNFKLQSGLRDWCTIPIL
jgi:hypothetical protein